MKKYKMLIVDDEVLIRQGLRARIAYFQFPDLEVLEAASGAEALKMFQSEEIALALVDICMPDMDGLELIRRAKEESGATQFLLLSGYSEFSYAQRAISLGVRAYMNKPVSNEQLKEEIETILIELRTESAAEAEETEIQEIDMEKELNILLSSTQKGIRPDLEYPGLCAQAPLVFGGGSIYLGVLHVGRWDHDGSKVSQSRLNSIRSAIRTGFLEVDCPCQRIAANSFQDPRRMYVVFMDEDGEELRHQVEKSFFSVRQHFERRVNTRITMGVSRRTGCLSPESFADACVALRQRKVYGRSNIYFYDDISAYETQPFPEAGLELLRKHMIRGDREGIRRQLKSLFSENQMENCNTMYLHVMWVRVVSLMMGIFNGLDTATINRLLDLITRVENISDREEIVEKLTDLAESCLRKDYSRDMNATGKIEYALEYIREHYNEDIVINDLAARLDMSPGYFSSMFKKEVGKTTMQYITDLRIERAMEYLLQTDQSVGVVAKSVGYKDCQYFFRVFKKVIGMTPLQYRQRAAKD